MVTAQPPADSSVYPRVYRASGGWLISLTLCGILLSIGGIAGTWFFSTQSVRNSHSRFWLIGLCLGFAALGIYCLLSTFRSRVVLFPDRIEVEELTRTKVISREEIRGWRSLPTSPPGFVLLPKDASRSPIRVAQVFRVDPEFMQWLYALPSLDGQDIRTSKAEIRNNARLGPTPGARMKTLAKGKRLAGIVNGVAVLAVLWGFLYPRPYELTVVILAALPWIALETVRTSTGLLRIDTNQNAVHPNVAIGFISPGLVLMIRSASDYNILLSPAVPWLSIGIGSLLFLTAFAVDRTMRTKVGTIATLLAISLAYGFGFAVEANGLLDRSPEASYIAKVEGKRIVGGRTTTYELELGPWGPKAKSSKLRVARATYGPIQRGDVVSLILRQGALGVNWYFMRAWQRGDQPGTSQ
jgi:hypothetical protein